MKLDYTSYVFLRDGRCKTSDGISPLKLFRLASKTSSNFKSPISFGIDP